MLKDGRRLGRGRWLNKCGGEEITQALDRHRTADDAEATASNSDGEREPFGLRLPCWWIRFVGEFEDGSALGTHGRSKFREAKE